MPLPHCERRGTQAPTQTGGASMTPRRVVMVAMPCAEVMEIAGTLDVFYAANVLLAEAGSSDPGYAVEVVSPVAIIRSWPGLCIKAERSYHDIRGPIDTLIIHWHGHAGRSDARCRA